MQLSDRPMVVVESGRPEAREAMVRSLDAAGFDVTTCPGPHHLYGGGCPLLESSDCFQVERASALVHDLDLEDPTSREVLLTLRERYSHLPIVVEASTAVARRHHELLDGCTVVPPFSPEHLAGVVQQVVRADVPA